MSNSVRTLSDAGCESCVAGCAFGADKFRYVELGAGTAMMHQDAVLAKQGRLGISAAQADAVADRLNLDLAPGGQVELFTQGFWHDETSGAVYGNNHGEMVIGMADERQE